MRVVDAHVHFWDPDLLEYPWLADLPALRRGFGPGDLGTGRHELAAAVFVEAGRRDDQALAEVAWVSGLARQWPPLRAIVAHAPVERGAADVRGHLVALARWPLVTGVRRNIQDEPPGYPLDGSFVDGVRAVADHGFAFDLCVRHHQLPEVTELVRRVPEVTFVLDHLGKPPVRAGAFDPWRERLSRLADLPNVVCKLSGLTTEADWARWRDADVLPYLRHALAEFGPQRCLTGGDWPVATLAAGYPRWLDTIEVALAGLTDAERHAVLEGVARRVYRIGGE